jgi:hypothetical protein
MPSEPDAGSDGSSTRRSRRRRSRHGRGVSALTPCATARPANLPGIAIGATMIRPDTKESTMPKAPRWEATPSDDDYAAAGRYLSLLMSAKRSTELATRMKKGSLVAHRANDLLRASGLALLPPDDPEVVKDLKKVKQGTKLSPVLLVLGELDHERPLTVADGYHRICASYHLDPDSEIPCCVVNGAG